MSELKQKSAWGRGEFAYGKQRVSSTSSFGADKESARSLDGPHSNFMR